MTDKRTAEAAGCPYAAAGKAKRQSGVVPSLTFDPVKQKVDVTGKHAFIPPQAGDKRGPCPGLNALANHGYLARNGVTNLAEAIAGTTEVYGMGADLAAFLSAYAVVIDGNPLTLEWSIGGSPGGPVFPPLLSPPLGLNGSHNKYESDSSSGRGDAYLHDGDASTLQIEYFKKLYDLQPEGQPANYNLEIVTKHRQWPLDFSTQNNPNFFYAPAPDGVLPADILKSFFGVSGTSNNLTYQKGHERIPDNWYRRQVGNDYGLVPFNSDILRIAAKVPGLLSVGGNTGKVNSFVGVDIANLTSGVYKAGNLLEGNNLICFAYQAMQIAAPDFLKGLTDITAALNLIKSKIAPQFAGLGCPQLSQYNGAVFNAYPGAVSGS
ncbi:Cloroperoxidase [Ceratobasidium sp. AG-I]|nr:Cloroperoxidase [Ceratobasidium sp. AG-I]